MTNFLMNEESRKQYAPALKLMEKDLAGYDEVYVLSPRDLKAQSKDINGVGMGVDLLEHGQMMKRLHDEAPDHYLKMTQLVEDMRDKKIADGIGEATISYQIGNGKDAFKVGIVVMPDEMLSWSHMGPKGILSSSELRLAKDSLGQMKEMRDYIALPHEIGHLVHDLKNNEFTMSTTDSADAAIVHRHQDTDETKIGREAAADRYMMETFKTAQQQGLITHPSIMSRFMNFRTIDGVDAALDGEKSEHATSFFMPNAPLNDKSYTSVDRGINELVKNSNTVIDDAYKRMDSKATPSAPWEKLTRDCVDRNTNIFQDALNRAGLVSLKKTFADCAMSNFETRKGIVSEAAQKSDPSSPARQIGKMYDDSAAREFPEETAMTAQKPAPGPGR